MRRIMLAVVILALGSGVGCGLASKAAEGEPVWLIGKTSATFRIPSHRVAFAAFEELKADLASVGKGELEVTLDTHYNPPGKPMPKVDEVKIPNDYPAFWYNLSEHTREPGPHIVNLRVISFDGKTLDGRNVEVWINMHGNGLETILSIQVGPKGDKDVSKGFLDKIAERLTRPTYKPGSPEERVAFLEFFGSNFEERTERNRNRGKSAE